MSNVGAGILNEIEKLFLKKKNILYIVVSALIPIMGAVLARALGNRIGIYVITPSYFPILMLSLLVNIIIPLFVFSTSADLFAGERSERTLKIVLIRPVTRFKVYLSKNIAIILFNVIELFIILIISIFSSMFIKSGSSAGYGWVQGFKSYSVSIIPMFSLVALAVFLSQFFRSGSGALTTCIFLYFLFRGAVFILPQLSKILPFSNTNWYSLWLGGSVSSTSILLILMSIISYCLIFFSAGFYFFDKRDI